MIKSITAAVALLLVISVSASSGNFGNCGAPGPGETLRQVELANGFECFYEKPTHRAKPVQVAEHTSMKPTPVAKPTPMKPTQAVEPEPAPMKPTPVEPIQAVEPEPAPMKPTPVEPIQAVEPEPAPMKPTPVEPTPVKSPVAKPLNNTAIMSALVGVPFTGRKHSFGIAMATTGKDTGYAVGYQFNMPPVRLMERNVDTKLQLRFGKSRRDMVGTVGFAIGF